LIDKNKTEKDVNTLKRLDIARNVQRETDLSLAESSEVVSQLFSHISDALMDGNNVKLADFGTFKLLRKKPRLGRNPKTGEECVIDARTVLTFKPSAFLRERVQSALEMQSGSVEYSALENLAADSSAGTRPKKHKRLV